MHKIGIDLPHFEPIHNRDMMGVIVGLQLDVKPAKNMIIWLVVEPLIILFPETIGYLHPSNGGCHPEKWMDAFGFLFGPTYDYF